MEKPTIYLGADHAGWQLKEVIEAHVKEQGYSVVDMGNQSLVQDDDYPDFGHAVAKRVMTDEHARGIVMCGNAQGICIVSNKVKGVRAVTGFDVEEAKSTREDDDSNILCLPARFIKEDQAKHIVDVWLSTPFSGEDRHIRRLKKVEDIEHQEFNG